MGKNNQNKGKTYFWQKIVLIVFGLFVTIIILEAGLRLGEFVFLSLQEYRNRLTIKQKGTYRIMCLGESTTALGGKDSYPSQLEEILNVHNLGIKFSVINKGRPATDTTNLLLQLDDNLKKYNPHMVIVMLGINDCGAHLPRQPVSTSKITNFVRSFRTYKLMKLIMLHIASKSKKSLIDFRNEGNQPVRQLVSFLPQSELVQVRQINTYAEDDSFKKVNGSPCDNDRSCLGLSELYRKQGKFIEGLEVLKRALMINPRNDQAYIVLGQIYIELGRLINAEESFKKAIETNPKNPDAYFLLGRICKDMKQFWLAEDMLQKALELDPKNFMAAVDLAETYRKEAKYGQAEEILQKALEVNPANDWLYGALAALYTEERDDQSANRVFKIANKLREDFYNPTTQYNYHRLKDALDKKGVRLVCVQYPIRSIIPLKKMFEEEGRVIFVDNEKIFKDAVEKEGYKEYFRDMFAGDFGHCTRKGNRLLAENIAIVILKEVFGK